MTAPAYPAQPAAMASAGLTLAAEFSDWQVAIIPAGPMWSAYWRSEDGRHRRYIIAPSAPQLLAALRDRAGSVTQAVTEGVVQV